METSNLSTGEWSKQPTLITPELPQNTGALTIGSGLSTAAAAAAAGRGANDRMRRYAFTVIIPQLFLSLL